jgi:hypothetical protein
MCSLRLLERKADDATIEIVLVLVVVLERLVLPNAMNDQRFEALSGFRAGVPSSATFRARGRLSL